HDHVQEQALLCVRLHDLAGDPADDAADNNPDDEVHRGSPPSESVSAADDDCEPAADSCVNSAVRSAARSSAAAPASTPRMTTPSTLRVASWTPTEPSWMTGFARRRVRRAARLVLRAA